MSKSRNFLASIVGFTSGATADTEFTVAHGMMDAQGNGIVPAGGIVCRKGGSASLYLGTTTWDTTNAYLKCNVSSIDFYVLFFV